jgi:hypothetical protein
VMSNPNRKEYRLPCGTLIAIEIDQHNDARIGFVSEETGQIYSCGSFNNQSWMGNPIRRIFPSGFTKAIAERLEAVAR